MWTIFSYYTVWSLGDNYPGEPFHPSSLSGIIRLHCVRIIWVLVIKLDLGNGWGPGFFFSGGGVVMGLHFCMGFSLVLVRWGYSSLPCTGFSLWWLLLWSMSSRHMGSSSCGSPALGHRLSSCGHRLSCPRPGTELMSPAVAGGFFTTDHQGSLGLRKLNPWWFWCRLSETTLWLTFIYELTIPNLSLKPRSLI